MKSSFETKQLESMSTWKENPCAQRAPDEEVKSAKRRKAVLQLQEFFGQVCTWNSSTAKERFKECCEQLSSQQACRVDASEKLLYSSLWFFGTGRRKICYKTGRLVLCDVSTLESVALLSGLQRCFERVDAFLKEHGEALKKLGAKNLDTALRTRHMAQFPMATFARVFLERYEEQLATEQVEALSMWQKHLCALSAAEQEATRAKRRKAVLRASRIFRQVCTWNSSTAKERFKECCEQLSSQKACRVEASSELFCSSLWLFGTGRQRSVTRLGIGPLRCVLFGVCGSSVRTSEMFWTCGCFLEGTRRDRLWKLFGATHPRLCLAWNL